MKDKDLIECINAFFKNNLNISETSRNAFLHRNTLLYRIEKIYRITGFNIRNFEDAMTFKLLSIYIQRQLKKLVKEMKTNLSKIILKIDEIYEEPKCELNYNSFYELLIAVILSAQCTDKRVNQVTKELFKNYNTPQKMITLSQDELENIIRPCGFFHNKASHILSCSKDLIEKYNGEIPNDKIKLKKLAGVGEKTANVMLATAFNIPAIAVDTHVFRVSNRLGLACSNDVKGTQRDLEKNLPKEKWIKFHFALILHGRYVCKSQNPKCNDCKLKNYCKFFNNKQK